MERPKDYLAGTKFGKLTVIGNYRKGYYGAGAIKRIYPTVLCRCDCGNEKRIVVDNLRRGSTTSCGCFRKQISAKNGRKSGRINGLKQRKYSTVESSARDLFQKYMKRNPGNLQFDEFYKLTQKTCHHCGALPNQKYLVKNATDSLGDYIYNGLDRIDNSKGYDSNNVITCCGTCNFMRHTLSLDEFYKHIRQILLYQQINS